MPRLAWALFACLWVSTLAVYRQTAPGDLLCQAAVFLLASVSLFSAGPSPPWRAPRLVWGLAAIAALALLQLVLDLTLSPSATALQAIRWLALAAWCVAAQCALPNSRRRFLELLVHAAGAFAVLSLLMWFTSGGRLYWWWPTPSSAILGPWLNPNHFAVWCELLLAPAVWLAAEKRQFWWAVFALVAAGAATGSRAGLGLMALELAILFIWLGFRARQPTGKLALALLTFPLLAALLGGDVLLRKIADAEPLLYRDQIWRSSLTLWRQQPWLGHGLGTYILAYPQAATFDTGELVDHAHNDWLEWGVEGGVAQFAILLAGYLYACRLVLATPWLLGLPLAGVHALVDYPLARFPLALWVVLLLTLATLDRPRSKLKQRLVRNFTQSALPPIRGTRSPHRTPIISAKTS